MNDLALRSVISVALIGMTILLAWQPKVAAEGPRPAMARIAGYALLGLWGIYGGMYPGGYATVLTLGCAALFGTRLIEAVAISKVVNFAGSLAASAFFVAQGRVEWDVALTMSATALLGGWLGAHLAVRGTADGSPSSLRGRRRARRKADV
jgi:uncharacterized membrane protein YfcA